ncbi:AI-2E family transporter [Haloarcula sp. S1CR25-12]|uniref:AI-2E family transporter n=1 Tax=Haloarcula saliterrae TaxID=2950534 RepID=A0ABU2FDY3_9EURY|nr:AI-2E family transporter [Haloarcula sp. S1CR25-12]MDS0260472.1 AI-2E family transporter [Haloarcula sp. S1CR25-12]
MTAAEGERSTAFLQFLLLVVGALSLLIVAPFLQALLSAGLVAYLVAPVNDRLGRRLGSTSGTVVTILLTVVVVVVPLVVLVSLAAEQALSVARTAQLPDAATVGARLQRWLGPAVDRSMLTGPLSSALRTGLRGLFGSFAGVVGGISAVAVGAVVFVFTLFYLLRDGDRFVNWLRRAAPLDAATADRLVRRTDELLWAAVVGNVAVAGVQAVLTVAGFVAVGFDNIAFWAVATFALSLLPIIGASIVWLPAVAYLLVVGDLPAAVGLFVYGTVIISGSDNVVRPLAMQRGADLNSGVLVVGIFGGLAVFGFVGLFVGPVVLGLGKALVAELVTQRERRGQ